MQSRFDRWMANTLDEARQRQLQQKATIRAQMIKGRHDLNLSQQNLADQINVAKSTIARIEAGNISPTAATLQKIADTLHISFVISGHPANDPLVKS